MVHDIRIILPANRQNYGLFNLPNARPDPTIMNLAGAAAIVTGASSGLGAEFSKALVARGAEVYGLARRGHRLTELHQLLGEAFHPIKCDVTDKEEVAETIIGLSRVDVLINNAGLGRFSPVDSQRSDDWQAQMDTNLTGVFYCIRAVVPIMKAQNARSGFGGHIINIASIAAHVGNPNLSAYNATKFGLRGFSEATMKELRSDGIKVSVLCPGSVGTGFGRKAGSHGAKQPMQPEDIAATVIHVLEAPDNYLISEVVMRPLRPRG